MFKSIHDIVYFSTSEVDYIRQRSVNKNRVIQFYNWGNETSLNPEDYWFHKFITNNINNIDRPIRLYSVFGSRRIPNKHSHGIKLFYTAENIHKHPFKIYSDYLLSDWSCQLALGFDYFEDSRYLRFPFWIQLFFSPGINCNDIAKQCLALRYPSQYTAERKFSCLVARHDESGLRTEMYNVLSQLGRVDCPSKLLHNDDSLHVEYGDNKRKYMNNYMFNICPENSNSYGYVTEKVFEAISAGCIPIYWGSYNNPEPGILNQDAIILWDREDGGKKAISEVSELMSSPKRYKEFAMQPRLLPSAEEKIEEMLAGLYDRLMKL